jgi:hypothetical protein
MGYLRVAIAAVAIVLAVFAAMLASDLRSWDNGIRNGDARYVQSPPSATWKAPVLLPFDLADGILGISDQVAFRHAAQAFVPVHLLGCGFDNCYTESRARADLETTLTGLARGPNRARNAEADNMLGILAFADSQTRGAAQAAPVDRAVADFQSAVQLDPSNAGAKYNLEWLHRQLVAHGSRAGPSNSQSPGKVGHKGAGGEVPGKGY